MKYRPKVYTASKIWHSTIWRKLASQRDGGFGDWSHVEFTARWPRMAHLEEDRSIPPTATDFRNFWYIDKIDVLRSDFVLLYGGPNDSKGFGEDNDILKGGLVEAGIALGANKHVVTVGIGLNHSWSHSAEVTRLPSLEEARNFFFRYHI